MVKLSASSNDWQIYAARVSRKWVKCESKSEKPCVISGLNEKIKELSNQVEETQAYCDDQLDAVNEAATELNISAHDSADQVDTFLALLNINNASTADPHRDVVDSDGAVVDQNGDGIDTDVHDGFDPNVVENSEDISANAAT
eukprot:91693_1